MGKMDLNVKQFNRKIYEYKTKGFNGCAETNGARA
jgi:hypothetical protein